MTLKELKDYIEKLPTNKMLPYSLSEPFSCRGYYDEVAFKVAEEPITREELLKRIQIAYTNTFYGYKGGEYQYSDYTKVHFEDNSGTWSDGKYVGEWIAKLEGAKLYKDQEERLVNLMFGCDYQSQDVDGRRIQKLTTSQLNDITHYHISSTADTSGKEGCED